MHRYLILIVLLAAGCGSNPSNKTPNPEKEAGAKKTELTASTPEEFAQSVVTVIAANDPNNFIEFVYPTKEELLAFVLKTVPADEKGKVTEDIEKGFDPHRNAVLDSFAKVKNELAGDGCDWNQAQSVRAKYEIKKRKGSSRTDIEVTFSADGQTYEFKLDECILMNGRWYTLNSMRSVTKDHDHEVEAKHDGHGEKADHDHGPGTEEGSKK